MPGYSSPSMKERVKKEDGELVIMRDGKITHVKAEEL